MARCELVIELDGDRRVFRAGEQVVGQVVVRTDDDVRCDGLFVDLFWGTSGDGLSSSGMPQEIELFQGSWTKGAVERYPFDFRLPAGPVSYTGHDFDVHWYLEARADIPWKIDPSTQVRVDLVASSEVDTDWRVLFQSDEHAPVFLRQTLAGESGLDEEKAADGFATPRSLGILGIGYGVLAAIFIVLCGWSLFNSVLDLVEGGTRWSEEWSRMAIELGFFAAGALVALWLLRSQIGYWRLGDVRFEIEPRLVRPGQTVQLRILGRPAADVELQGVTCRLEATETTRVARSASSHGRSSGGSPTQTRLRSVFGQKVEMAESQTLRADYPFRIQGEIALPSDAAPTFGSTNARLRWQVKVSVRVQGWPNWEARREIIVHP